jgi:hypothetical protein
VEVQNTAALVPSAVPCLLAALGRPQRQQLAAAIHGLQQQQQHHGGQHGRQRQQQQQQQHGQLQEQELLSQPSSGDHACAAAAAAAAALGPWDVLLLLGLQPQVPQQQWDADVSLLLLQGVQDAARCARLRVVWWWQCACIVCVCVCV